MSKQNNWIQKKSRHKITETSLLVQQQDRGWHNCMRKGNFVKE